MGEQFDASRPIYAQLVERLKARILAGTYPPGGHLDSVRDLAADAGVNPNTMQRALAQLETEGLVRTERTAGRYVTEDTALIEQLRACLLYTSILLWVLFSKAAFFRVTSELPRSARRMPSFPPLMVPPLICVSPLSLIHI